ncbi:MAG: hypothetical protein ABIO61_06235 [Thermomonas sp.]
MKTTSILLVAAMFAASGMAVAANKDAGKPAAAPANAMATAATHHHHKAHKAAAASAAKVAPAKADAAKPN